MPALMLFCLCTSCPLASGFPEHPKFPRRLSSLSNQSPLIHSGTCNPFVLHYGACTIIKELTKLNHNCLISWFSPSLCFSIYCYSVDVPWLLEELVNELHCCDLCWLRKVFKYLFILSEPQFINQLVMGESHKLVFKALVQSLKWPTNSFKF